MRKRSVLVVVAVLLTALAFGDFERGNRLYREGEYRAAVEAYRAALESGNDSPELHYNLGTALLQLGRYKRAERHLRRALESVEPELRQRAFYNLGNRYLRAARAEDTPARARTKLLAAASAAYKQALRLDPSDRAAKWNYELTLRERQRRPRRPRLGGRRARQRQNQRPQSGGAGGRQNRPARRPPSAGTGGERRRMAARGEMTRSRARRILRAVAQDERSLLRKKLSEGRSQTPVARDW